MSNARYKKPGRKPIPQNHKIKYVSFSIPKPLKHKLLVIADQTSITKNHKGGLNSAIINFLINNYETNLKQ